MAESPAIARTGRRRAVHIASNSAAAASIITRTDGMATRRSAILRAPSPCTVPVIPWRANVARSTGTLASHGERDPKAKPATAAGIISCVKGTTMKLEGNPIVVARWK
jgi:hypothetical protein